VKPAAGRDLRIVLRLDEEVIREALAAFCAGVDEVGDLDDALRFAADLLGLGDELRGNGLC
jgi:hypothetical protein